MSSSLPLVLVHGLWDTPRVFERLRQQLAGRRPEIFSPHLPHRFGATGLLELANQLDREIQARYGTEQPLDLLGYSMGGVVGRSWIQLLGGHQRCRRFISLGSPQQGTLVAQPWPRWPLAGVADMKIGSALLQRLNGNLAPLAKLQCHSYYCLLDHMVVPSWRGVLPVGSVERLPVQQHRQLISSPLALGPITEALLA
jgi:triacylglycerol lipase